MAAIGSAFTWIDTGELLGIVVIMVDNTVGGEVGTELQLTKSGWLHTLSEVSKCSPPGQVNSSTLALSVFEKEQM